MKKISLMVLILGFCLNCFSGNGKVRLAGKFLTLSKSDSRNIVGATRYFHFVKEGKPYAYPIKISEEVWREIRRRPKAQYFIDARLSHKKVPIGEFEKSVTYLHVKNAKPIALSALRPKGYEPGMKVYKNHSVRATNNGQIQVSGVNDTVTNSLIFVGGAYLLGTILLDK